jgi:hypothetical protein
MARAATEEALALAAGAGVSAWVVVELEDSLSDSF